LTLVVVVPHAMPYAPVTMPDVCQLMAHVVATVFVVVVAVVANRKVYPDHS